MWDTIIHSGNQSFGTCLLRFLFKPASETTVPVVLPAPLLFKIGMHNAQVMLGGENMYGGSIFRTSSVTGSCTNMSWSKKFKIYIGLREESLLIYIIMGLTTTIKTHTGEAQWWQSWVLHTSKNYNYLFHNRKLIIYCIYIYNVKCMWMWNLQNEWKLGER